VIGDLWPVETHSYYWFGEPGTFHSSIVFRRKALSCFFLMVLGDQIPGPAVTKLGGPGPGVRMAGLDPITLQWESFGL